MAWPAISRSDCLSGPAQGWIRRVDTSDWRLHRLIQETVEWTPIAAWAEILVGSRSPVAIGFVTASFVNPLKRFDILETKGVGTAVHLRQRLGTRTAY